MPIDRSSKNDTRQRRMAQQLASGSGFGFTGGLRFDINNGEVSVDIGTNAGLTVTIDGLEILLDTNPGLVLGSNGLKVLLDTNPGLVLGAGGVKILLPGSSGLELVAGGLTIDLDTNSGLALGADGLSVLAGGKLTPTATKTGTYGAALGELVRCDPSAAGFTVNLPAATGTGRTIIVKNVTSSTNAITLDGSGGETIDGAATISIITAFGAAMIVDAGSGVWDRIV